MPAVRTFYLMRKEDPTGVSGTGLVAYGALFPNGKAALVWNTPYKSVGVYDSMTDLEAIHCHGGLTEVVYMGE